MSVNDPRFKPFFDNLAKIENELAREVPSLGQAAAEEIKKRTRAGYGVSSNEGNKERLAALSDGYKRRRARAQLSPETSASRSNLTFSGSMLDSIQFVPISRFEGRVTPTGTDENGISNVDKAFYVTEQGRPFLYLSKPEIRRLRDLLRTKLSTILRGLF